MLHQESQSFHYSDSMAAHLHQEELHFWWQLLGGGPKLGGHPPQLVAS